MLINIHQKQPFFYYKHCLQYTTLKNLSLKIIFTYSHHLDYLNYTFLAYVHLQALYGKNNKYLNN